MALMAGLGVWWVKVRADVVLFWMRAEELGFEGSGYGLKFVHISAAFCSLL